MGLGVGGFESQFVQAVGEEEERASGKPLNWPHEHEPNQGDPGAAGISWVAGPSGRTPHASHAVQLPGT